MDLRDPWGTSEALLEATATPAWIALATREERRCGRDAALVVANTEPAAEALVARYPIVRGKVCVVRNGWDAVEDSGPPEPDGPFIIAYTGTLYFDRSPRNLFRAAARMIAQVGADATDVRLEIMGRVENGTPEQIRRMASEEGVGGSVVLHPPGSHAEARALMAKASVLVSLPWSHTLAVPAKIYEYMAFPARLLVLADDGTAPARLLADTDAHIVAPDDVGSMAAVLASCYSAFTAGAVTAPLSASGRFGRRRETEVLARALDDVSASWRV
jgi:hypothetical protein